MLRILLSGCKRFFKFLKILKIANFRLLKSKIGDFGLCGSNLEKKEKFLKIFSSFFLGASAKVENAPHFRQYSRLSLFYKPNGQNFRRKNPAKILAKLSQNWSLGSFFGF